VTPDVRAPDRFVAVGIFARGVFTPKRPEKSLANRHHEKSLANRRHKTVIDRRHEIEIIWPVSKGDGLYG